MKEVHTCNCGDVHEERKPLPLVNSNAMAAAPQQPLIIRNDTGCAPAAIPGTFTIQFR